MQSAAPDLGTIECELTAQLAWWLGNWPPGNVSWVRFPHGTTLCVIHRLFFRVWLSCVKAKRISRINRGPKVCKQKNLPNFLFHLCSQHGLAVIAARRHGVLIYRLKQVLTGHGNFGKYLFRICREETVGCRHCGNQAEDTEHTVAVCPTWAEPRRVLSKRNADSHSRVESSATYVRGLRRRGRRQVALLRQATPRAIDCAEGGASYADSCRCQYLIIYSPREPRAGGRSCLETSVRGRSPRLVLLYRVCTRDRSSPSLTDTPLKTYIGRHDDDYPLINGNGEYFLSCWLMFKDVGNREHGVQGLPRPEQ
uniref:SFRICE_001132 n=1 Tax=Spodoptera frugiperda TaxID=7108 RepID=A0A2H1VFT2_SPOFR